MNRVGTWLRTYGPWLLLLGALWSWRETFLELRHERQVWEVLWQEQQVRLSIAEGALTLAVGDKFKRHAYVVSSLRHWRTEHAR